jgi:hypothetical protein
MECNKNRELKKERNKFSQKIHSDKKERRRKKSSLRLRERWCRWHNIFQSFWPFILQVLQDLFGQKLKFSKKTFGCYPMKIWSLPAVSKTLRFRSQLKMSSTTFINPTNFQWENIVFSEKQGHCRKSTLLHLMRILNDLSWKYNLLNIGRYKWKILADV